MVDGHEHKEVVKHRRVFTKQYIEELELRCHRWVQMTVEEFSDLPCRQDILVGGHNYCNHDGTPMIELHVDVHQDLQEYANAKYGEYGGNTSVRKPDDVKPMILFGQDEAVYSQFTFGCKQWVTGSGVRSILPKSEGAGLMLSAVQSREFGFGIEFTEEMLSQVNQKRLNETYIDEVAAMDVYGTKKKKPLTESPFVRKLEYGANKDGYWNGNMMIIQLEDIVDVLKVAIGSELDYAMLLDHSSGHAKMRVGGLDASKIAKAHNPFKQRNTLIERKEGFLGEYHCISNPKMVQVGEEQSMSWDGPIADGDGPWYMSPTEREATRKDKLVPIPENKWVRKEKTKRMLVDEMLENDNTNLLERETLMKLLLLALQKMAVKMGIAIVYIKKHNLKTGWENKGKGLMQVLWERGFINTSQTSEYQLEKKDSDGKLIKHLSLRYLMSSCDDFMNEKCQIEHIAEKLGITVVITTKYHAEYAGEGIEYSWGYSKSLYRRQPLAAKQGKDSFHTLVDKCTSRQFITIDMVRKFSKRARDYMQAYMALEAMNNNKDDNELQPIEDESNARVSHQMIEKMKKMVSSHRAALDFDKRFLNVVIAEGFDVIASLKSERTIKQDEKDSKRRKLGG